MGKNDKVSSLLFQLIKGDQQRKLIEQLIWNLIKECASQDEEIRYFAGECLGELGAVDPYAIAFFFPTKEMITESEDNKDILLMGKVQIIMIPLSC